MSAKDPNNVHYYHNEGQEDASEGTYDPPKNDIVREILGRQDYEQQQYDAYNAGYSNTKNQSNSK
jgi:hypothetical protein